MKFEVRDAFLVDGAPTKLISGAVHYFRIAPCKWYQSLANLKAMGGNTVETYIPWNFHEPKRSVFDFSGWHDLNRFLIEAEELGLMVIIRPSPYICAEWEFGGLPAWLLRRPVRIRTTDINYMEAVTAYYQHLMPILVPHQVTQGGGVIMMQVENEYGSYGSDQKYIKALTNLMRAQGVDVPLFTADGGWQAALEAGGAPDLGLIPTVNFGSEPDLNFDALQTFHRRNRLRYPLMCMEFWDGWFNQWGNSVIRRSPKETLATVKAVLSRGSINFYMFHGGTNFGFMNGANDSTEDGYQPQVTSYDYDGLLTEQGNPTLKYQVIRDYLEEQLHRELPQPIVSQARDYGVLRPKQRTSLFANLNNLTAPRVSNSPLTMTELDQDYGCVVYQRREPLEENTAHFQLIDTADRAQVFLDGTRIAIRTRANMEDSFFSSESVVGRRLTVLVENTGRTNYGPRMGQVYQSKGMRGGIRQNLAFLYDWNQYVLDFRDISKLDYDLPEVPGTPTVTKFELFIDQPQETFINMTKWGRGIVLINGLNLGRFWDIGPYVTLFAPADVFQIGVNQIEVVQLEGRMIQKLQFSEKPVEI
ncbi:glycoside hydrolase family 35 protein [Lacticaseibacillus daqingensis]|uniref:glycoside hydrolase family 35 protein n=1 Tax=Lacticaseibacillus daqingensis TaxID=2486014 RepID=UPI0013DE32EC|nr:beta-galactosidase family protein [Lacticaseibacillus daqingensis]